MFRTIKEMLSEEEAVESCICTVLGGVVGNFFKFFLNVLCS
ncbi:MAG: hypothetical protein MOIL_01042 [Candidatus Methanolliviera sp. GoM_oil]|nr:MAG: hypothetical protein MOIL_01042 [Candidatus Methanolliviera sp. GoM_oil]